MGWAREISWKGTSSPLVAGRFEDALHIKKENQLLQNIFLGGKHKMLNQFTLRSILGKDEQSEATHVIYPEGRRQENDCAKGGKWNEELVKNAFHVVDQWLEDSIKLKERQDEKLYRVR